MFLQNSGIYWRAHKVPKPRRMTSSWYLKINKAKVASNSLEMTDFVKQNYWNSGPNLLVFLINRHDEIWGSYDSEDDNVVLLGCDVMQIHR
jgi:hypothetical protein